jgi:hypothetical protein
MLVRNNMKKIILLYAFLSACFSMCAQDKLAVESGAQYNGTVYDRTKEGNINGGGVMLQVRLHRERSRIAPFLEATADVFGGNREIQLINGQPVDIKRGVIGIYGGAAWYPLPRLFGSLATGVTFISYGKYFALKPAIGYHFGPRHGFTMRLSLTNTFERNAISNEDFGVVAFGVSFKL